LSPLKLKNDITEDRDRVKALGEVFTPTSLVEYVLDLVNNTAFSDPTKTFIDSMCGDGQFLIGIKNRKLRNGMTEKNAVDGIYGIDLTPLNVDQSIKRINGLPTHIKCSDSLGTLFSSPKPVTKTNSKKQSPIENKLNPQLFQLS
jgi:type I restriction-modification system DNA methylase subunit